MFAVRQEKTHNKLFLCHALRVKRTVNNFFAERFFVVRYREDAWHVRKKRTTKIFTHGKLGFPRSERPKRHVRREMSKFYVKSAGREMYKQTNSRRSVASFPPEKVERWRLQLTTNATLRPPGCQIGPDHERCRDR
jgi:hypothetical protein